MEILLQNITQALGWTIVHSLWQGTIIYGIICLIYLLMPNLSSKNKYIIALLAQVTLFISFVSTFIYYMDVPPVTTQPFLDYGALLNIPFQEVSYSVEQLSRPFLPWLSSFYVLGLFVQLVLLSNSYTKLHYLKNQGLSHVPAAWNQSFQHVYAKARIKRPVHFFLSEKVSVPLTLGHLKPIILFPIAFVNNLPVEHVESILMHELAHIKRHDYLYNLCKVLMETILFFNPFVWLLSRHLETERENACDDTVMSWTPSPIAYAQALMSVEVLKTSSAPIHAMAAVGKTHHLLHRIQRITNMNKNQINAQRHLIAIALCLVTLITVAWVTPKENPNSFLEGSHLSRYKENRSNMSQTQPKASIPYITRSRQDSIKPTTQTEKAPRTNNNATVEETNIAYHRPSDLKDKLVDIEELTSQTIEYFNSPEWKEKIEDIEAHARNIQEYYTSQEWKDQIADIETQARNETAEFFQSQEWKDQMASIEKEARKAEEYFNSKEWKQKLVDIEINAKKMAEQYNSIE